MASIKFYSHLTTMTGNWWREPGSKKKYVLSIATIYPHSSLLASPAELGGRKVLMLGAQRGLHPPSLTINYS